MCVSAALFLLAATHLPPGFQRLDYIESTGTQYIDTGVRYKPLELVSGGHAKAVFEFGEMPSQADADSAASQVALFNSYLNEVTGAEIPTSGTAALKLRIDLDPVTNLMTRFDWAIDSPDATTLRIRATEVSLFTALRQILERGLDARFLGVENGMFQYEPRTALRLPEGLRMRSRPHSYSLHREITYLPGHARELGLSNDGHFRYSHGLTSIAFPADTYNAIGWPVAIMPTINGAKLVRPSNPVSGWQPCYSNPETADIAASNIVAYLNAHPAVLSVSLGVNDNGGWCECDACQTMDAGAEASIFSNDPQRHSPSYYTFVSRVAAKVAETHPCVRFGCLAYLGTVIPPPFELPPTVVPVMTCDYLSAGMRPGQLGQQEGVLARWGAKVPVIGTWDYCWGRTYDLPRVHFENQADRLKFLYANGGRAYFGEDSTMADVMDGPKIYLTSRLLENIDADPEAILTEWYERFAGKAAAPTLRTLYGKCRDYWLSSEMKKTPFYAGTTLVYQAPADSHLFALKPGETAGMLADAKQVLALAGTAGERRRAQILVHHFAYLHGVATFRGVAYVNPANGELDDAGKAATMLNNLADTANATFADWTAATNYFQNADFENPQVYISRNAVQLDAAALLGEMFGKAVTFVGNANVDSAFARLEDVEALPPESRRLVDAIVDGTGENAFSNPGFALPLSVSTIVTDVPYELDTTVQRNGGNTLRLSPGQGSGSLRFVEDLPYGSYLALADVRAAGSGHSFELTARRQRNGSDLDWTSPAKTALDANVWRTFAKTVSFNDLVDGVNLAFSFSGFGANETAFIGNARLIRLGDVPPVRSGTIQATSISSRGTQQHGTLNGETAALADATVYDFAHASMNITRILPAERLQLTLRASRPAGSDGRLGVFIYEKVDGTWVQHTNMLWNWQPPSGSYGETSCSISGETLGKRNGSYLLIFFHMTGTGPVGLSQVKWKID